MRKTKHKWWVPAIMALCLLSPQPGKSQQRTWSYGSTPRGWIGVTVDYQMQMVGNQTQTLVLIKEVEEGSPAAAAGLRPGDVLTHMDGRSVSPRYFNSLPQTLEAGDLVKMVVRRDEGPVEVTVEAVQWPSTVVVYQPDIERMVVTLDTLRGAISRNLESLTVTMNNLHLQGTDGMVAIQLLRDRANDVAISSQGTIFKFPDATFDTLSAGRNAFVVAPEFTMTFQDFLEGSEETDSLNKALILIRKDLNEVRRLEISRERQIAAAIQGPTEEYLRADELLQRLRIQESELASQQEETATQLSRVREEALEQRWYAVEANSAERARAEAEARAVEEVYDVQFQGIRSPHLIGQAYILGAEMKPLTRAMAKVLSVSIDDGVLVYQVPEGTPAAEVGLRDLDVIVQIAGEEITSLGDVRMSLELFPRPVRIRVIRMGEPVEIEIRR